MKYCSQFPGKYYLDVAFLLLRKFQKMSYQQSLTYFSSAIYSFRHSSDVFLQKWNKRGMKEEWVTCAAWLEDEAENSVSYIHNNILKLVNQSFRFNLDPSNVVSYTCQKLCIDFSISILMDWISTENQKLLLSLKSYKSRIWIVIF